MSRSYEEISFVSIQDGQDSPLTLISSSIQLDSPLPSPTTGTNPKKGDQQEEEKEERGKEEDEEEEDESLAINYGASRKSKMTTRRMRYRSTPYSSSSSSRSHRSVGVQTSFSNSARSSSTPTFLNQFFVGTPNIYNLCSCKDHICSEDKK